MAVASSIRPRAMIAWSRTVGSASFSERGSGGSTAAGMARRPSARAAWARTSAIGDDSGIDGAVPGLSGDAAARSQAVERPDEVTGGDGVGLRVGQGGARQGRSRPPPS